MGFEDEFYHGSGSFDLDFGQGDRQQDRKGILESGTERPGYNSSVQHKFKLLLLLGNIHWYEASRIGKS